MLPEIFIDLEKLLPADVLEPFVRVGLLLDSLGHTDHEMDIADIIYTPDFTINDIARGVRNVLIENLDTVLVEYGVLLVEDPIPPMSFMYRLLNTIYTCDIGDAEDILDLVADLDPDPVMILSAISEQLDGPTAIDIATYVDEIDEALIERLLSRPTVVMDGEISSVEVLDRYVDFIKDKKSGVVYDFIKRRSTLPLTFIYTLRALKQDILALDDLDKIAHELVSMAIASNMPKETMKDTLDKAIEDNFIAELLMTLTPKVNKLIEEYINGK